ncbi:L-histidine N(alpha)-methyltransferase [Roseivirga sp. BDSF3-8]|uniref:L-histidine N(alpha)-methyltransferase n=1 Tax=Roseivirga sp. BDSF3-8 TaxID=3241598 RepID=UPI003531BF7F
MTVTKAPLEEEVRQTFAREVLEGLKADQKSLPSKYFYNEKGDRLFQQIMEMDEYYLTRSEYEIMKQGRERFLDIFSAKGSFQLIELGPGDGMKTKVLLEHFSKADTDFEYMPLDISGNVLDILVADVNQRYPNLKVKPLCDDYFRALDWLSTHNKGRKVVLFMGGNIGNYEPGAARDFLKEVSRYLVPGDLLVIGFDLKKQPSKILAAYNDRQGITAEFNLNLLDRMNEELGTDFDRNNFIHYPVYNPASGACRSYLVSKEKQHVTFPGEDETIPFDAWEAIYMEVSQKYSLGQIEAMAHELGFAVHEHMFDSQKYFVDSVWEWQ